MADMDMIPGDYRQDRGLRRRLRHFVTACIVVLCCIGLARMLLYYLTWRESAEVARLEQLEQVSQKNKTRKEEYRQKKEVTEQQLAALNKLRGGDRVTLFLQAIDSAHNNGIWFDNLRYMRRSGTGTLDNVPGAANMKILVVPKRAEANVLREITQDAEIVGHAINHSVLADFMRILATRPGVADVRLIDTRTRAYLTTSVVDFNLGLQIDEKAQGQR